MSECVVRMEKPESCKKCISTNCIWGKEGSDYLDVIAALQDFRRANNVGFPDFCPIICQLPEGHGRLVDADDVNNHIMGYVDLRDCPTIVPAERKVYASDAVTPTDTPTDTPTVPAERSEE